MKKWISLILILLCFALLASCGKKEEEAAPPEEDDEEEIVVTFDYAAGVFTTNLAPSENKATHIIQTDITLKLKSQKFLDTLNGSTGEAEAAGGHGASAESEGGGVAATNLLRIRDTITFVLRNTTAEEITADDVNKQQSLRDEITAALNEEFETKSFVGVSFGNFVVS
ncbi:MAG: flagellar basal body-associated FliL family protein [Oscillospiraceae bacterium]|nr:flagellar basal body-associated FliL family protein [Oscillospiraceae bacterium]